MAYEIVIYFIIGFFLVATIIFWLFMELQYKCKVRVKELIKGRKLISDYKAKEHFDGDGVVWWRLKGEKRKDRKLLPAPPEECIELNKKGRKCSECYRTETGDVIWVTDKGEPATIPESIFDNVPEEIEEIDDEPLKLQKLGEWKARITEQWKRKNNVISAYQPISTKQRVIYFNNLRKAEQRKGLDWKMQLVPIFSIGAVVLVVIGLMVFWGDLTRPSLQANDQFIQAQQIQKDVVDILKEIKLGQQRIEQKINEIDKDVPPG